MQKAHPSLETIGKAVGNFPVELSTRFLEHFSEQLYSSPQKAFKELISNGWDAGADCVDVRISADLNDPNATMCALDNGASMDTEGLHQLWHIAFFAMADLLFELETRTADYFLPEKFLESLDELRGDISQEIQTVLGDMEEQDLKWLPQAASELTPWQLLR
jgi:hypothetical protein